MPWRWSPSVVAEIVAAASVLVLAIYFPWRELSRRAGFFGSSLLLACASWMLSHAVEIGLPAPAPKSYLMGAQLIWGIIASTFWWLYIVHHIGSNKWLSKRFYILLGIAPSIVILGTCTNPLHNLIWSTPGLDSVDPYLPLQPAYGIVYWIGMAYVFALTLSGSLLIIKNVIRRNHGRTRESVGLLIAAALPMLAALVETLGLSISLRLSIGITPWASYIGSLLLIWNLPRFHLHKVIPIARDTIFERIKDNIIVLDKWDRVIDLNPAAERFMGYGISEARGLAVKQMLPQWPDPFGLTAQTIESHREIAIERGGTRRIFNLSLSVAADSDGYATSKVVLLTDITQRKEAEEERQQSAEKILIALKATIESIARTTEIRDPYTAGHQRRVAQLAFAIAGEIDLPKDEREAIRMAAVIHDIGKIHVPAEILSKPGKLSENEFRLIQLHPQAGFDIIKDIEFPWPIAQIVLQHHERMNGSGYPSGLSGGAILMEARILAVADVVEAMDSHRPYRPALGIDKALEEISRNKGTLYDADVVDACVRLFREKSFKFIEI
ncbi:MAG: histidine kinase N-terminal 7TM domain-containing protein [Acidobacteriota bacterium]|nr:histidine kinase N-terminal 7TM domain-containing protein [Acidobacteriota bacterium]